MVDVVDEGRVAPFLFSPALDFHDADTKQLHIFAAAIAEKSFRDQAQILLTKAEISRIKAERLADGKEWPFNIPLDPADIGLAMDVAITEAVKNCKRENQYECFESNDRSGAMLVRRKGTNFQARVSISYTLFLEAATAFMDGDLLRAFQLREQFNASFKVAP